MKSQMKSAFAIIAVALMIMVAVVPMVGVFTEDSSAASGVTDPDQASMDKIKLTFNLYNTDGTAVSDSDLFVKLTWNSGKNVQYVTKGTQITFDETKMTGAKAIVGKNNTSATFVQETTFPEYVIGDVAAGTTLAVDIYKGTKATSKITFQDAANVSIYTTLTGAFGAGITAMVTYDLYDKVDATQPIESNKTAALGSSGFVAYYPATYADVFVKVTKVTVTLADASSKDVAFSNATAYRIVGTGAGITLKADQTILTITNVAGIPQGVVSNVVGTGATSVTEIDGKISATKSAYFMYTMASGTTSVTDFKYTLTFGNVIFTEATTTELSSKAFYGTYSMASSNAVSAQDGASLSFVVKDSAGAIVAGTEKTAYVAGGYYIAQVPTKEDGQSYAAISTDVKISTAVSIAGKVDITAATEGTPEGGVSPQAYKMVYVSGTVNNAPAGYTFTISGATKTFGLSDNKIVCKGSGYTATFGFYMVGNTYIEFKVADGSAFSDATTTKYFIGSTTAKTVTLALEQKVMKFKFTDGDAKAVSSVTVGVYDTVAKKVLAASDYTADTTKATVTLNDGTIDLSKLNVWFTATNNTFTANSQKTAVAYVAGTDGKMAVSSLETTYYVFVKDANGNIMSADLKYATTTAYVAEDGTKVYAADASTSIGSPATDGSYSIRVNKNLVNVTLTGEPQDVLIFKASQTGYIFDTKPCLATADANNTMVITAKADGFTATIYKTDGVTPIVNTEFKLVDSSSSTIDVATTDKDGKISFTSNATIADDSKIVATVATALGDIKNTASAPTTNVASSHVFYSKFLATNNIFTVDITDADGAEYLYPLSTYEFKLGAATATIANNVITVASSAKVGDILDVTFKTNSSGNAVRTFDKYTLTADDIKNGTISLVSKESTYSVSAVDADGETVYLTASTVVQKKVAGVYTTLEASSGFVYSWTEYKNALGNTIAYDFVLTAPAENEVYYAYPVASDATYALTHTAFDEKNVAVAESIMSTIVFELVEANGAAIYYGLNLQSTDPVKVGSVVCKNILGTNKYYFVGDATAANKVTVLTETIGDSSYYSFEANQLIVDGVIKAYQQTVYFTATDAAGLPIDGEFDLYAEFPYGGEQDTNYNLEFDENGDAYMVIPLNALEEAGIVGFLLKDSDSVYTFTTDGTDFVAAEQTVDFTFSYANGVYRAFQSTASISKVVVISEDGYRTELSSAAIDDAEAIVDLTNVASYEVTVTYSGSTTTSVTFYGTSSDVRCVDSYIQGFAAIGTGYSVIATGYKGTTPIGTTEDITYSTTTGMYSITAYIPEGYSILVQCYNASGVLYAQATLDSKTTMICDLVSVTPIAETLKAKVLDYGADYVKLNFANGKVYLTADDKYSVETVDGLYVQTYKFAGWYVNGVKVTDDLNCAIDNVDTNVVSANYVLDDSKELGKDSAAGISPTVLAIGIAAVIIALIAVVYAVIQKKE